MQNIISTHYLTQRQTMLYRFPMKMYSISTHYLTQRQTQMQQILEEYQLFQLTTSHRGRPLRALQKTSMLYFNSLPHTEVDNDQRKEWLRKYISTHYLTQRQTLVYENTTSSIAISTHYLTQRQTTGDPKPEENFLNFNSLPHTEVDRRGPYLFVRNRISTHYLTQRQTITILIA